jgi:hypothetical protein
MRAPYETAQRHQEPFAVQFSVFMPNRVGQFQELLQHFANQHVRLVGVSVIDSTDWAVVRMIFDQPGHARQLLKEGHESFTEAEVLLVELHSDSALQEILQSLLRAEINVHFAFPLTIRSNDNAVMAIHVDDLCLARQVLTRMEFILLSDEDLADPS